LINHVLEKADAKNKRARTMDIDDFIRYKQININLEIYIIYKKRRVYIFRIYHL